MSIFPLCFPGVSWREKKSFVDAATAIRRAALAGFAVIVIRLAVIQQYFLAGFDVAQGEKQQMPADQRQTAIRITRMIDVLGPIAADRTVNRPVRINAADANSALASQPAGGFNTRNSLTDELSNLAPFFESDGGETTFAVNL